MTSVCKGFLALLASSSILASACAHNALAQEEPTEAPAATATSDEDEIEFDDTVVEESEEGDAAATLNEELEKVVAAELDATTQANSPEELINLATEIKLTASTLIDLTKVVSLCNKAEVLGLDEENLEFARQLRLSAQLDRGLAIAQIFLNPDVEVIQLPNGWEGLRDNAIADLNFVVKDNPEIPVVRLSLGRLYMLADKNELAKGEFDAVINSDDDSVEVQFKTLAYMFRAMLEENAMNAIPMVEKALELSPTEVPRLYAMYSEYLLATSRTSEALTQIDKAIELDPENPLYKKAKAGLLAKVHREDEARALFDEVVKSSPDNLILQIDKAQFLVSIKDYEGALEHYTNLMKRFDGPGLYYLRGAVYAQMNQFDQALADAEESLRRDSSLLPAMRLKGIIFTQMKKYDDAIKTFEQMRRKATDEASKLEATTQISFVLSKQGYYTRAAEILKKELEKNPDSVEALRTYADMELLYGRWADALRLYERLLELVPNDTGVLNNYSWLLSTCPDDQYRNGSRALETAQKAAEGTLYSAPHILSTLASAYAEIGDFDAAREWATKAVELGEKERHESLEELRKELESYKENKPWRETSEIMTEIEETPAPSAAAEAPAESPSETPSEDKASEESTPESN